LSRNFHLSLTGDLQVRSGRETPDELRLAKALSRDNICWQRWS